MTTQPKPALVTLAVPVDKADIFTAIEGRGNLWLVPTLAVEEPAARSSGRQPLTLAEVLGLKPPLEPPPPFETAIYRRSQMQINRFLEGKLLASQTQYWGGRPSRSTNRGVGGGLPANPPSDLAPRRKSKPLMLTALSRRPKRTCDASDRRRGAVVTVLVL